MTREEWLEIALEEIAGLIALEERSERDNSRIRMLARLIEDAEQCERPGAQMRLFDPDDVHAVEPIEPFSTPGYVPDWAEPLR